MPVVPKSKVHKSANKPNNRAPSVNNKHVRKLKGMDPPSPGASLPSLPAKKGVVKPIKRNDEAEDTPDAKHYEQFKRSPSDSRKVQNNRYLTRSALIADRLEPIHLRYPCK